MTDAPVPARPRLSPRGERANLIAACLFWGAALAYLLYGAYHGQVHLPGRGTTVVVYGWAAWLTCLIPVLAFAGHVVHIRHRAGRVGNKALIATLIGELVGLMLVIWIAVPGPLNPLG